MSYQTDKAIAIRDFGNIRTEHGDDLVHVSSSDANVIFYHGLERYGLRAEQCWVEQRSISILRANSMREY